MTVEERLRDASEQLRTATDLLRVPEPRFAQPVRDRRPSFAAIAIGALSLAAVAIGLLVWRDPDNKKQISTVAPPTTFATTEPDAQAGRPDTLPKLTGSNFQSAKMLLMSLKLNFEFSGNFEGDPETGRVVAQDPPAGTALAPFIAAKGHVRLTIGAPLAVAVDEIDVGLTGDSPQGRWRVVASEGAAGYCVAVFNQGTNVTNCVPSLADLQTSAFFPGYNPAVGVYGGSAPEGTTAVELVDGSGNVVATATVSNSASGRFHGLVFWAAVVSQPNLTVKISTANPQAVAPNGNLINITTAQVQAEAERQERANPAPKGYIHSYGVNNDGVVEPQALCKVYDRPIQPGEEPCVSLGKR